MQDTASYDLQHCDPSQSEGTSSYIKVAFKLHGPHFLRGENCTDVWASEHLRHSDYSVKSLSLPETLRESENDFNICTWDSSWTLMNGGPRPRLRILLDSELKLQCSVPRNQTARLWNLFLSNLLLMFQCWQRKPAASCNKNHLIQCDSGLHQSTWQTTALRSALCLVQLAIVS